ncbi:aminopeptidase [Halopseudomonas pelagia]|uniref:aminopeptidase n=1 Tax=Halopseudomonas pelagia TaxID=553151 RepID=UPI0003B4CCD5|nr:aminopeptidase [Halopseudomonas pelagia]
MKRVLALMLTALLIAGCSSIAFVQHAWQGQREVMALSVPIVDLLESPNTDPALKVRLAEALTARRFASESLSLPDNQSYTRYSALPRPYALWNLFVAPELSLKPVQHCYLFTGCLAYKGYFSREAVEAAAQHWQRQGMDVFIGDIPAYSTLGWYDDPLLSSMLHGDDDFVALTLFHELAHQRFYLKDDTAFNESFANFVGQEGLRQWRASKGLAPPDPALARQQAEFNALVMATRERLHAVYASDLPETATRSAKDKEFAQLRSDYTQWRDERWNGSTRFDGWFAGELNNASLLPFGLYDYWVPAFAMLFEQTGREWLAFYQAVERIGRLAPVDREAVLQRLLQAAPTDQWLISSDQSKKIRETGWTDDHP